MAVGGWWTDSFGSWNYRKGEYDTCRYFIVVLGLPVWFSFRGCVHLIDAPALKRGKDYERIRRFLIRYLGYSEFEASALDRDLYIPLKPSRLPKAMALWYCLLWITSAGAIGAVFDTLAVYNSRRALTPGEDVFLAVCWSCFVLFVSGLIAYLTLRRPSPRRRKIRQIVAKQIGPFADVADWERQFLLRILAAHGISDPSPGAVLNLAQHQSVFGSREEALLLARMAIGAGYLPSTDPLVIRAESLTDACLDALFPNHSV